MTNLMERIFSCRLSVIHNVQDVYSNIINELVASQNALACFSSYGDYIYAICALRNGREATGRPRKTLDSAKPSIYEYVPRSVRHMRHIYPILFKYLKRNGRFPRTRAGVYEKTKGAHRCIRRRRSERSSR